MSVKVVYHVFKKSPNFFGGLAMRCVPRLLSVIVTVFCFAGLIGCTSPATERLTLGAMRRVCTDHVLILNRTSQPLFIDETWTATTQPAPILVFCDKRCIVPGEIQDVPLATRLTSDQMLLLYSAELPGIKSPLPAFQHRIYVNKFCDEIVIEFKEK